jgi:hypothetical protein
VIFISYRRESSVNYARLLFGLIGVEIGEENVFFDQQSIPLGADWLGAIIDGLDAAEVVVALIAEDWMTAADDQGLRRIDDVNDLVRFEIATALERGLPVVPVLLNRVEMPRVSELPEDIKGLTRLQAIRFDFAPWKLPKQTTRLIEHLVKVVNQERD